MLNKAYISPRISVNSYSETEITEVRAPTDESVRLLKEMEEAARKKVLDAVPIGNTNLDIKLLVESDNFDVFACALMIKINGERHKCKLSLPDSFRWMSRDERLAAIKQSAAEALGILFLQELARRPEERQALSLLFGQR